ncbi:ribosome small subunit-dependent GTPase A [Comamonas sp. NLF-1-9]|uniref:ribosome small subunit-dependent GTPase A n=1 Tax=Comamonas sp. NLF-1-9 TaxID=2853163 RepID=UPI001C4886E1|nr:ribosome small subunit-dependent GTPase A [Comamonas sp. NLF-1-9]QXL84463.1 ribosome small subunit-dependent GTPase A [Comamonas sp. NLF-1-9]
MNDGAGLVVAAFGRHCVVEGPDGARRICHPRGKKNLPVVGDRVLWQGARHGDGEGTVEQILQRRNLLYRQDAVRSKSFAANLDQVLILIAAEPTFSESLLTRALIACEAAGVRPLIALNKSDLVAPFAQAWQRLWPYRHMGGETEGAHHYQVLPLSLTQSAEVDRKALAQLLHGKTTLVLGPSGAGKSTLVNLLVPGADVLTGELSQALGAGRHTTTTTTLYWLDDARRSALIDSPGFQSFGLNHIAPTDLARLMPDFALHLGSCRFYNCTHLHEPGCAVLASVAQGQDSQRISPSRHRIYRELFAELSAPAY